MRLWLLLALGVAAAPGVRLLPVAPGHARNSINATIFCHPLTSHGHTQYVAWYDGEGHLMLAKRRLGSTRWEIRRTPYTGQIRDAHNGISLAVDGNGILHLSWDHHGNPLNYARSVAPGSLDLTAKMPMNGETESRVTYPEFFNLPDGDLLFLYRDGASGRGNTVLKRYLAQSRRWITLQNPLIDGQGQRNAYTNQIAVGRDGTWHISWCWRESGDVASNHDICYARSSDGGRTWRRSSGVPYALPITEAGAEVVVRVPQSSDLINTGTMTVDARGRPLIATYWRPAGAETPQYQLVWREGARWQSAPIGRRATPFHLGGLGTRRIPISRPLVLAGLRDAVYVVFRDEERGDGVSVAVSKDPKRADWRVTDLAAESVDHWEPTCDAALWSRERKLHLFYQRVGQDDADRPVPLPPQMVSILEWTP